MLGAAACMFFWCFVFQPGLASSRMVSKENALGEDFSFVRQPHCVMQPFCGFTTFFDM